jgi:hypothetical protein
MKRRKHMANDEQKKQTGSQTGTKSQEQKQVPQPQKPTLDEKIYNQKGIGKLRRVV